MYYEINENAAKRAKEMNSFFSYEDGSATAGYKSSVDEVIQLADRQKKRVDQEYHEKIDYYVDLYARKLAENINRGNAIDVRVPSIMIAGGSNFPIGKKAKQNAARDRNMEEWRKIEGIKDKIRSIGMGGIRSDDSNAVSKLEKKLAGKSNYELVTTDQLVMTAGTYNYPDHQDGSPLGDSNKD